MISFTYERSSEPHDAVAAVSKAGAKFISGGTNLLDLMKLEIERPLHLVDISRLPLKEVEELPDGGLRIGAQVPNSNLAADVRVRTRYPVLSHALLAGASGCATRHPPAGTSCSARAAPTSTTRRPPATSAIPAPVARPSVASTAGSRSSARAMRASPHIHRTWRWR